MPLAVDAGEPVAGEATAADGDSQSTVTYHITVDAPSPLKETLTREVGLVRWQGYSEMTEDLLDRLAREAIDETRNFAAAEGYFNAAIDVRIDRTTTPTEVTLVVKTGTPTRIASVRIEVTGAAATDAPLGTEAIASIRRDWTLPEGAQFRQQAWSLAKERALNTLSGSPYAAARIVRTKGARTTSEVARPIRACRWGGISAVALPATRPAPALSPESSARTSSMWQIGHSPGRSER